MTTQFQFPGTMEAREQSHRNMVAHGLANLQEISNLLTVASWDSAGLGGLQEVEHCIQMAGERHSSLRGQLEAWSINSSQLRHQLSTLRKNTNRQIDEEKEATKQLNAAERTHLQGLLDVTKKNVVALACRRESLQADIDRLRTERELSRTDHEAVIDRLNQGMEDKASQRITLNAAVDEAQSNRKQVADMEEDLIVLAEQMEGEWESFRAEKGKLEEEVREAEEAVHSAEQDTIEKEREVDFLRKQVGCKREIVEELKASLTSLLVSISRLEMQEQQEEEKVRRKQQEVEALEACRRGLRSELEELRQSHEERMYRSGMLWQKSQRDLECLQQQCERIREQRWEPEREMQSALDTERANSRGVQELSRRVEEAEAQVVGRVQQTGQMRSQTEHIRIQTKSLEEEHRAMMLVLTARLKECEKTLKQEREENAESSERHSSLQTKVEQYEQEHNHLMTALETELGDGQDLIQTLNNKAKELEKSIVCVEDKVLVLTAELEKTTDLCHKVDFSFREDIQKLQEESEVLSVLLKIQQEELLVQEPPFQELSQEYNLKKDADTQLKRDTTGLKNKLAEIEEGCRVAVTERNRIWQSYNELFKALSEKKMFYLQQLREQNSEMLQAEKQVYIAGHMLKEVLEENATFKQVTQRLEMDMEHLQIVDRGIPTEMEHLSSQAKRLAMQLSDNWDQQKWLQAHGSALDLNLMAQVRDLKQDTLQRQYILSGAHRTLHAEMQHYTSMLHRRSSCTSTQKI